jgi:hypothetical protein
MEVKKRCVLSSAAIEVEEANMLFSEDKDANKPPVWLVNEDLSAVMQVSATAPFLEPDITYLA